jgi:UDP-N-acetylmuramate: L-alanyl-gamma-D-glutamyl-meso-diaminopimelate ligase
VVYSSGRSRFKLGEENFEIPLIGEFNVRNAAMAATAARFYEVPKTKIDNAFKSFSGIARRQELRGEARGVKVIDDFGHHPTAIAYTLQALRIVIAATALKLSLPRGARFFNSSFRS